MGKLAGRRKRRFVLVLDEAQELRKVAGYDLTYHGHIYDYERGVQMVVTGSQVGVLEDFLRVDDAKSPLFGRVGMEIEMPHLSDEEARDFLTRGCKQAGIKPNRSSSTMWLRNSTVSWVGSPTWGLREEAREAR